MSEFGVEAVLSIIALVISVLSGVFSGITFWWTARRDRKQATFEAFYRLQNEVFDNINLKTRADVKHIAEHPREAAFTEYSQYLARIEQFCVGVSVKIYDGKVVKKVAAKYLEDVYRKSLPIIEKKRAIYPNEPQCAEFQRIVEVMNR